MDGFYPTNLKNAVIYAALILILLFVYGIFGSIYIMHLGVIDAIYYTITTVTTTGFGDIRPITPSQKLFTASLELIGAGFLLYIFTLMLSVMFMSFSEYVTGAKLKRKIASMKNHFILCGFGRVGSTAFKELKKRKQKVVIIEKNKDLVETELWSDPNIIAIPGDATKENVLRYAGIERAKCIIIATGSDVDNLFITIEAKELNPKIWIVARASERENISRLKKAGANRIISPEFSGGKDIYFAAMEPLMMKITVKHGIESIKREAEIIFKHNCTLENIMYHLPEFREPLKRKIEVSDLDHIEKFLFQVKKNPRLRESLNKMYESTSGVHSHWISGPSKENLEKVVEDLKKEGILLGVNLDDEKIKEITRKYGMLAEVMVKPEITVVNKHGIDEIRDEAEIILKHGCTIEDIEYYIPGFREPLKRHVGADSIEDIDKFLNTLKKDPKKYDAIDRLYMLSGGGIHSHVISARSLESLNKVEKELKEKGFLIGVNMSLGEIKEMIQKSGTVVDILVQHDVKNLEDKKTVVKYGGRILTSKHYLPGIRYVLTRKLNLKTMEDVKKCEKELEKPRARRTLTALYELSANIHSHTIVTPSAEITKKIEEELKEKGILLGVNFPEEKIWEMVEKEAVEPFCVD